MNASATLECSQCGGPLELNGCDAQTVRCSYCGALVVAPEELREKKPVERPAPVARGQGRSLLSCNAAITLVVMFLLTAVFCGAIYFFAMRPAQEEAEPSSG